MTTISRYRNGNCTVELHDDGTKTRTWHGEAMPELPESVDLKITNQCRFGCAFCHETALEGGGHAPMSRIFRLVDGLPGGVEIAVGGGDPLLHPGLDGVLRGLRERELIPNLTINARSLTEDAIARVNGLRRDGLIYGLGVSYVPGAEDEIGAVTDSRTVIHLIAGIHDVRDAMRLPRAWKCLVLGFKRWGRAEGLDVTDSLSRWNWWLARFVAGRAVAFDNLAVEQLGLRDRMTPEGWAKFYMGDDGKFSMYVDAVANAYAPSSAQARTVAPDGASILDMYRTLGDAQRFALAAASRPSRRSAPRTPTRTRPAARCAD